MSLLDFGEAREEDGGIVIGSPISTESMVSFETDSFASFEFNENSNNAYSAASVTG